MKRNLLLTPGPTYVPPQICEVLGKPIIHHRTPQFQEYLKEAIAGLQDIFQTKNDMYVLASSGTGALEASVCSFLSPKDKVIAVKGGKFGERWAELAKAFDVEAIEVDVEWGQAVSPDLIKKLLAENKDVKAVYVTLCETSTGVTADIKALGEAVKGSQAILVVDAVSGLGVTDIKTDAWCVDVVAAASHKGLMLPPGLAFVSVSKKASTLMDSSTCASYYFDLKKYRKVFSKPDTPFTPAIGLVIALTESLRLMKAEGIENRFAHYARMGQAVQAATKALGLSLFADPSCASNVLTAICLPDNVDGTKLVKLMRDTHGISVAGGQAQLKGKIIRIAHMGYLDEYDILAGISCLEKCLKELGHTFELGAGLAAAQNFLNT